MTSTKKNEDKTMLMRRRYLEESSSTSSATPSIMRVSTESRLKRDNLTKTRLTSSVLGKRSRQKTGIKCSRGKMTLSSSLPF